MSHRAQTSKARQMAVFYLQTENEEQTMVPALSLQLVRTDRPVQTLADLLVELDAWTKLPVKTRRVLKSNVRTAGLAARVASGLKKGRKDRLIRDDVMLASVPANPAWLNEHLYAYPAAVLGTKKGCLALSISGLRRIMRRVGLIEALPSEPELLSTRWSELLARLDPLVYCLGSLSGFARWCHANGIAPEQVSRETLVRYETFVRTRTLHSEVPRLVGKLTKGWREAAKVLRDWPQGPLVAPPRREIVTLPFSDFPVSFQQEIAAWCERLQGTGPRSPFRGDGPRRPLRRSSVKSRRYNLRQAASALVRLGRDPATITSLADLVDEVAFEAILQFYWDRAVAARTLAEGQPPRELQGTAQTTAIATALMSVARYHCKLEGDTLVRLRNMARDVTAPVQGQLSQKNRDRLRQFDDPVIRAKLLHLPERLMRQAEGPGLRPCEAARLARVAAAIELLLHIPLRNGNLSELRLGVNLRYGDARQERISHLVFTPDQMKNRYLGEWAIGPELSAFLHRYIRVFRPILATAGGDCLFPAGFGEEGSLSPIAMAQSINKIIAEEVGAIVNPHLFRCLCARFILEHSPHALEDIRLLLGDKSLRVVLAHYAAVEPSHACRRHDEMLRRMRHKSSHLAGPPAKGTRKPAR